MDVLTDTMSTTQMQSKTGRVDSYDAMIEAERKMYSILYAQAAVKAEDYAYDDDEDAIRRNASDDLFAGYKAGKASQAAVKAENDADDEEDALTDAYDEEDALTATSDDFYTGYIIGKASQAAVKVENDVEDAIDKLFRKKINLMRARRDALHEFRKNHHV